MNWDILLLLHHINISGKLDTNLLWIIHSELKGLLSDRVYEDLQNQGVFYTDDMYDRLVMDVYIRLYHKCYKNSIQMFILILLLTLRDNDTESNMFTIQVQSYMVRLNTLKWTEHNGIMDYLLTDTEHTYRFFKPFVEYIESFDINNKTWNSIANTPMKVFAFTTTKLLYERNKNKLIEQIEGV